MTSKYHQSDLLTSGIDIDTSTAWCRLLEVERKARKATVDTCYETKRLAWANKYRS
jgi:hypothetical protein